MKSTHSSEKGNQSNEHGGAHVSVEEDSREQAVHVAVAVAVS